MFIYLLTYAYTCTEKGLCIYLFYECTNVWPVSRGKKTILGPLIGPEILTKWDPGSLYFLPPCVRLGIDTIPHGTIDTIPHGTVYVRYRIYVREV